MAIYAVRYTYIDDAARTDAVRPEHRDFLRGLAARGTLLVAGAFATGEAPGAQLALRGDSREAVAQALEADPFQREGIVTGVEITEWTPVVGPWAEALNAPSGH